MARHAWVKDGGTTARRGVRSEWSGRSGGSHPPIAFPVMQLCVSMIPSVLVKRHASTCEGCLRVGLVVGCRGGRVGLDRWWVAVVGSRGPRCARVVGSVIVVEGFELAQCLE